MTTQEGLVSIWVETDGFDAVEIFIDIEKHLDDLARVIIVDPLLPSITGAMKFYYATDRESIEPETTIDEVEKELFKRGARRLIVKPVTVAPMPVRPLLFETIANSYAELIELGVLLVILIFWISKIIDGFIGLAGDG